MGENYLKILVKPQPLASFFARYHFPMDAQKLRERLQTRKGKLATRFIFLVLVALVFAKLAPTLADENAPAPDTSTPTISATPTPSASAEPTPTPSASVSAEPTPTPVLSPVPSDPIIESPSPVPSTSGSAAASPSPSPSPSVLPVAKQIMQLKVPSNLKADPRANTLYFPPINITSSEHLLICISSPDLFIDVYIRNQVDSIFGGVQLVAGDMSHQVLVTGTSAQVAAIINGAGGFSTFNPTKPVAGSSVLLQAVAVSAPILNPGFCSKGTSVNVKDSKVSALGITLDFKKGDIPLKR
jgi:hypothetical protein